MKVLIAYATHHGATREIAERISFDLSRVGLAPTVADVTEARDLAPYDAFVIGSAIYGGSWLDDAIRFVRRNRESLAAKPVWLFSSGPLGIAETAAQRRQAMRLAMPLDLRGFEDLGPRDDRIFYGSYDPGSDPIGSLEWWCRYVLATSPTFPAGDFREWHAIDAWANEIGTELTAETVA